MGFADTGDSRLRNNRKLVGSKYRMNDAHLKVGKYYKEKSNKEKCNDKNKISKDELENFKFEFKKKKRLENIKSFVLLISLIAITVIIGILLYTYIN